MDYKTVIIYAIIVFAIIIAIYWFTSYLDILNPHLGNVKGIFSGSEWITGSWGPCGEPCGNSIKKRTVVCKNKAGIDSIYCDNTKKPSETEECNLGPCSLWKTGQWSNCSTKCGPGIQTRTVSCLDFGGKAGICKESARPKQEQQCEIEKCGKWVTSEWTPCYPQCGQGTMTRLVECITPDGSSTNTCQGDKPQTTSTCTNKDKCGRWQAGEWGQCNAKCGGGKQTRSVKCVDDTGKEINNCILADFPGVVQQCNMRPCGSWKIGEWKTCSKICGGGVQTRDITCVAPDGTTISNSDCHDEKPINSQPCNLKDCPK
jgi:hypothetical protein